MLISAVLKFAREYDVVASQIRQDKGNIIDEVNACGSVKEMNAVVLDFILSAKEMLKKYKSRPKQLADTIKNYIGEQYSMEDLSLNMMAKDLYISTSYISAIFKNDIGKSFVDYLTAIRIEKAKQLLIASQSKTYEIGHMVGYRTPQYFSTIFKKETGFSPSEYRKKFGSE